LNKLSRRFALLSTSILKDNNMRHYFLLLGMSLSIIACKSQTSETSTSTNQAESLSSEAPAAAAAAISEDKPQKSGENLSSRPAVYNPIAFTPEKSFHADRADLHESLDILHLDENTLKYKVHMENGDGCEFDFSGIAKLGGGGESDADKEGNGFDVDEYVDDKNGTCSIWIRLGAEKSYKNQARFIVGDCRIKHCENKPESESLTSQ
jgi:hypothetical protein